MAITSRAEFLEYCYRALGKPLIEINIADEQAEDRIDDALDYYKLFHTDALDKVIMTHEITQTDIDNGYITVEEPVVAITQVLSAGTGIPDQNWAQGAWQYKYDYFSSINFGGSSTLSGYVMSMQSINMLDDVMGNNPAFDYSSHSNKLYIYDDWTRYEVGSSIAYIAYVAIDETTNTDIWNDIWLKDYATALIGRQWGSNLQKFQDFPLSGGMTLNGDAIYEKYNALVEKLQEDLELKFVTPPDFLVG